MSNIDETQAKRDYFEALSAKWYKMQEVIKHDLAFEGTLQQYIETLSIEESKETIRRWNETYQALVDAEDLLRQLWVDL